MWEGRPLVWLGLVLWLLPAGAGAQTQDAIPTHPFEPGETITFDQVEKLRNYIPEPFWENREYFFFEGMQMSIGPFFKDYPPSEDRVAATAEYGGTARIGRDGSLENFLLGEPFPDIDPEDPDAGLKHAWNFDYKHDAIEGKASFYFSYWDRGELLPLWFQGIAWGLRLSHRADYADSGGTVFDQEKRKGAGGLVVEGPPDYRGIMGLGYRYNSIDGPRDEARVDDVWVYIPDLRRVRRISASQRTDSIAGTDMTPDDQGGFSGFTTHFNWKYIGETVVLAPIDTRLQGYPLVKDANFGPMGFSLANDEWQLRKAIILEQYPKDKDHIYKRKRLWVDKDTYTSLYAAAYDRYDELWKLIYLAYRWSEREDQPGRIEGINVLFPVCNIVVNIRTGTGVRVEFWDIQPTRLRRGQIRKQIDVGRLSRRGR